MTTAHDDDDKIEAINTGVVVPLRKSPSVLPKNVDVEPQTRARQLARNVAKPLPHPKRMARTVKWWTLVSLQTLPWLLPMLLKELGPIWRGICTFMTAWAHWVQATKRHGYAKEAEGNIKTRHGTAADRLASVRRWFSAIVVVTAIGTGVWAYGAHRVYLIGALLLLAVVFDFLGRMKEPAKATPPPLAMVLADSSPLSKVTATILEALTREGFEEGSVGVAEPMWWDETRRQFEISLSLADYLKPEHVRAIERAIGAKDYSIRNLATEVATIRRLIITLGDPLPGGQECEWIPTGSLSFRDPLPLGRSAGTLPMAVRFLGVHCGIVGKTRSGKTEGLLWTIIDRLAACKDVVIWGIDLQAGPAFPLWRRVIQRVAYTPEDALALLKAGIEEMNRRKLILTALAESDEAEHEDAGTVWTADLGPFVELIIDEFALATTYDGKSGKLDLMSDLEVFIRTGLKFGFHLILATQKTGNSDFGSTVMQTQLGLKFMLSCEMDDTVRMFTVDMRDSGWSPQLLKPAQDDIAYDAGKCYIKGPGHNEPDIYRSDYWPKGSIKPRARRRIADGLPSLDDDQLSEDTVDAVEIPQILAAVEAAFAAIGNPDFMASKGLLVLLEDDGMVLTETELGVAMNDAFAAAGVERNDKRKRVPGEKNAVRGYWLANIRDAIGGFS